jgi:hypothetical protein
VAARANCRLFFEREAFVSPTVSPSHVGTFLLSMTPQPVSRGIEPTLDALAALLDELPDGPVVAPLDRLDVLRRIYGGKHHAEVRIQLAIGTDVAGTTVIDDQSPTGLELLDALVGKASRLVDEMLLELLSSCTRHAS